MRCCPGRWLSPAQVDEDKDSDDFTKRGADWDALAATLDTLIVHGIDIEGESYSHPHDIVNRKMTTLS